MIVISDLFDMFMRDLQIEANEARYLINELVNTITKSRALEDALVIVSLPFVSSSYNHSDKSFMSYNKTIVPRFDKCIEITNSHENRNKMIDIRIRNDCTRNKYTIDDFRNHKVSCSIKERDLLIAY